MQLVIPIENFNINNVFFNNPIPNTVLDGSLFVRVIYSDEFITFNGIYLGIRWKFNSSSFILFNSDNSDELLDLDNDTKDFINEEKDINDLLVIEEKILNKFNIKNKTKVLQVPEQIKNIFNNLKKKYSQDNPNLKNLSFIFKCSGIWITDNSYGLTFKIIDTNFNHQ